MQSMDVEQLIEELDRVHPDWDMYRAITKIWCITVKRSGQKFVANSPDLREALEKAIAWEPLPLVPRPPVVFYESEMEVQKDRSKWAIHKDNRFFLGNFSTKREALQRIEILVRESQKNYQQWEQEWGWSKTKNEGVDFRFNRAF